MRTQSKKELKTTNGAAEVIFVIKDTGRPSAAGLRLDCPVLLEENCSDLSFKETLDRRLLWHIHVYTVQCMQYVASIKLQF